MIDENAFAKKGEMAVGVARQWNGRLGKTHNSQAGVFAAVTRDGIAALVEGELYVPEEWFAEPERCADAGMPEDIEFRTRGEMALTMIYCLRSEGLRCAYTAFDAGYGQAQRHTVDDHPILAARHEVYLRARELNSARWSGDTRNWLPIGAVNLNLERDSITKTHLVGNQIQPLAA